MATSAELAAQIADYDKNKKSSADILNEAMTQYGVPEIRSRVAGLRTTLGNTEAALNAVDPSVTGRTSRSLVTEAQRQRMVANERAPIAQQYSSQSGALTTESANLSDQQAAAKLLAEQKISDYTTGRNALQSQYDTAYTREQNAIAQEVARQAAAREQANADREYQLNVSKLNQEDTKPSLEQALNQLGTAFKSGKNTARFYTGEDTYMTREQAAYSLANAANIPYKDALKEVYKRFKTAEGK